MKGTRPLDKRDDMFHRHIRRTQPLSIQIGVSTGGRISELLSLTIHVFTWHKRHVRLTALYCHRHRYPRFNWEKRPRSVS